MKGRLLQRYYILVGHCQYPYSVFDVNFFLNAAVMALSSAIVCCLAGGLEQRPRRLGSAPHDTLISL